MIRSLRIKATFHSRLFMHPCRQETGWQSVMRSCILPGLPTHLVQELNVGTVPSFWISLTHGHFKHAVYSRVICRERCIFQILTLSQMYTICKLKKEHIYILIFTNDLKEKEKENSNEETYKWDTLSYTLILPNFFVKSDGPRSQTVNINSVWNHYSFFFFIFFSFVFGR